MLPLEIFSRGREIAFGTFLCVLAAAPARADLLVLDTGGSGHGPGYVWRFDEHTGVAKAGFGVENEGLSALAAPGQREVFVTSNVLGMYSLHRFDAHGVHRGSVADVPAGQMRGVTRAEDGLLHALVFDERTQRWRIVQLEGATAGIFIDEGGENLTAPVAMVWGGDNTLLVLDRTRGVLRFNALDGAFVDVLIPLGRGGLVEPTDLEVGSDGNLYVACGALNAVLRFDRRTGEFIDPFVEPGSGGLVNAQGLTFGPDGNLYVTSRDTQRVLRFDGRSGAYLGVAAELPHVQFAGDVVFVPATPAVRKHSIARESTRIGANEKPASTSAHLCVNPGRSRKPIGWL